jgi:hypothetical protein
LRHSQCSWCLGDGVILVERAHVCSPGPLPLLPRGVCAQGSTLTTSVCRRRLASKGRATGGGHGSLALQDFLSLGNLPALPATQTFRFCTPCPHPPLPAPLLQSTAGLGQVQLFWRLGFLFVQKGPHRTFLMGL